MCEGFWLHPLVDNGNAFVNEWAIQNRNPNIFEMLLTQVN
jgi:hypothetical protein